MIALAPSMVQCIPERLRRVPIATLYHLVIETPDCTLSRGMQWLNGCYAQSFNRRHHRVGHLFQGRFKGILVDGEEYFLELCRYVVLNPVRAGMVERAGDYVWSSYRATAGLAPAPDWLTTSAILGRLRRDPTEAQQLSIVSSSTMSSRFLRHGRSSRARCIWEDRSFSARFRTRSMPRSEATSILGR